MIFIIINTIYNCVHNNATYTFHNEKKINIKKVKIFTVINHNLLLRENES